MALRKPDPTFHASPKLAMQAPVERYAYTLMLSPDGSVPDGLAIVDVDPTSSDYGKIVHQVIMPNKGDEFHHFGWNACSSALSPLTGHAFLERRFLIIPGIRSSRIYIIDTQGGPKSAKIHKIIEPEEIFAKTGYSRPHTIHCGPEGVYVSTLGGGGPDGTDGPPGIFIMDCETFEVIGRWRSIAGCRTSTTIFGGIYRAITWSARNGACRRNSRMVLFRKICWPTNMAIAFISGTCAAARMCRPLILVKTINGAGDPPGP